MTSDPKIFALALLGGIIPSLLWLWFWLKQEETNPEPKAVLTAVFIMGMIGVVCVIPIQKFIQAHVGGVGDQLMLWAGAEEIIKYLAILVIIYGTNYIDEPIDWPIYMITAALGFAALENALFLLKPLDLGNNITGLLIVELRFLGSTLLHTVASGILGISLAMSLRLEGFKKKWYLLIGLIVATALHSVFNFFIIRIGEDGFLKVFGFLWVVTIILMLLFEKVRRMN